MFKINLLFLAFIALSASAHESPSFSSLKQCVSEAYSSDGLDMSTREARKYCQSVNFSFSSIKQCVSDAYSADGFNMSTSEAREYCQQAFKKH